MKGRKFMKNIFRHVATVLIFRGAEAQRKSKENNDFYPKNYRSEDTSGGIKLKESW